MTPEKTLFNIRSMGKAFSTADQRKNAKKTTVSRTPRIIRDGNADATALNLQEKKPRRNTLH